MSRPKKTVVDYFPHFVNHGKTMFTIENKYGNDGYTFWFKLLEMLGATEHHFIDCNNDETWEYLLAKTRLNEETVRNMLNLLAKIGAIDKELWEAKIIRSDNLIKNLETVYKRRNINVYTKAEVMGLCIQKPRSTGVSDNIKPQSKVKESKVKKINNVENSETKFSDGDETRYLEDDVNIKAAKHLRDKILEFNPKCKVPENKIDKLQKWANDIRLLFERDKRSITEFKKVVNFVFDKDDFWKAQIQSPSGLRRHWDRIYSKMMINSRDGPKNKVVQQNNYEQREYSDEHFEGMYKNV